MAQVSELSVDFEWGVVELVVEGNSGPSVEDGLEVGTDVFAVGVDLVDFGLFVQVLLKREADDKEVDDQSLAVAVDFGAKVAGEFLKERFFFRVDSFVDLPAAVVEGTGQDDNFVLIQHEDLAERDKDVVDWVLGSQFLGDLLG